MRVSGHALLKVRQKLAKGSTILDVGAGSGEHASWFKENGYDVKTTDILPGHDFVGDFNKIWYKGILVPHGQFDCIWCSHVLEHQLNPNQFLNAMLSLLKPGGIFAITVPPRKDRLVGGHVNLYTPLSLMYNLVLAHLDCSGASMKVYGYNISVVTINNRLEHLPKLKFDNGDIETLSYLFPTEVKQNMNGFKYEGVNW